MSFADVVSSVKKGPDTVVADLVWQSLPSRRENEPKPPANVYRASGLYGLCPRKEFLKHFLPREDVWTSKSLDKMNIGTALHWWWQNHYLGPMGVLLGQWKCLACGSTSDEMMPMPTERCKCSKDWARWEFVEKRVHYKIPGTNLLIVGHYDGILQIVANGKRYLIDLKTTGPKLFAKLKEASEAYIFQLQLYMELEGWEEEGLLIFIDRGESQKPKEFLVPRRPEIITLCVSKIKKVEAVKTQIEKQEPVGGAWEAPDRICEDRITGKFGMWCDYCDECFNDIAMCEIVKKANAA